MTDQTSPDLKANLPASVKSYARYLLVMAGLGGLLYGIDVGIISAALPHLQKTTSYSPAELSLVTAAVLFGSAISSLIAGILADAFGRRAIIILGAALFILSIPIICLSGNNFPILFSGRLLQGASGGLIGVVVPLYLAECLGAESRGKGTAMFQFLLTAGLLLAAIIGLFVGQHVDAVKDAFGSDSSELFRAMQNAWQLIFWCSLPPVVILFFGAFKLSESPRWLFRKGKTDEALKALARNNGEEQAQVIFDEMVQTEKEEKAEAERLKAQKSSGGSLLQRRYVIPFLLAVAICAFNQATGINSVLNYSVAVFQQAGLEDSLGNYADVAIKLVNCLMTVIAMILVDKKGRKFLLKIGTGGVIIGLAGVAILFNVMESGRVDVTQKLLPLVEAQKIANIAATATAQGEEQQGLPKDLVLDLGDQAVKDALGVTADMNLSNMQLILSYKQSSIKEPWYMYGSDSRLGVYNFQKENAKTKELEATKIEIDGEADAKADKSGKIAKTMTLVKAELGEKPTPSIGWPVMGFFILFIAFYAVGPGVCVWLALSELMPSRIRSNGMAIALLINQTVSTVIAGSFLPWVCSSGYSSVFFTLSICTIGYFHVVTYFLPETKGRTLEEIEEYFASGKMPPERTGN